MHIYLSREIFHAHKFHSEFQCPMINTVVGHVFQNDFITFQHDSCGLTIGKAMQFYQKVYTMFICHMHDFIS